MRSFWRVAALAAGMAGALPLGAETYSVSTLPAELRRLEGQAGQGRSIEVPAAWEIEGPQGKISISTEPLKTLLAGKRGGNAAEWLEHVAREVEESAGAAPADGARGRLNAILARREFAALGPPSAWQLLRDRILAWIGRLLDRLFGAISRHPTTSRILFWAVIIGAGCVLLLGLVRLGQRERTALNLGASSGPVPARSWAEWLQAARLAAERGDLREAVRCAYWAGVTRLQEAGTIDQGGTHTPREYLRLAQASGSGSAPELAALTKSLERVWYAGGTATADDFRASLENLEALGCRTE